MLLALATLTKVVERQHVVSPPVFTICIQESALTNRKTTILTQTTQAASEKNPRNPWQNNCTVLFDRSDAAPPCLLLFLQSQVHIDPQNTGIWKKEQVCNLEKCHFTGIKWHYYSTVTKIKTSVLWLHTFSTELTTQKFHFLSETGRLANNGGFVQ